MPPGTGRSGGRRPRAAGTAAWSSSVSAWAPARFGAGDAGRYSGLAGQGLCPVPVSARLVGRLYGDEPGDKCRDEQHAHPARAPRRRRLTLRSRATRASESRSSLSDSATDASTMATSVSLRSGVARSRHSRVRLSRVPR